MQYLVDKMYSFSERVKSECQKRRELFDLIHTCSFWLFSKIRLFIPSKVVSSSHWKYSQCAKGSKGSFKRRVPKMLQAITATEESHCNFSRLPLDDNSTHWTVSVLYVYQSHSALFLCLNCLYPISKILPSNDSIIVRFILCVWQRVGVHMMFTCSVNVGPTKVLLFLTYYV